MLVPGLLLAALTLGSVPAETPEARATEAIVLRWAAPTGCPDVEQARALVERLVPNTGAKLRADVRIDEIAGSFVGTLALSAEPGPTIRRLQGEDCTVLARALAVVIAVSLDPIAAAESHRVLPAAPEPESMTPIPIKEDAKLESKRASALDRSPNERERERAQARGTDELDATRTERGPEWSVEGDHASPEPPPVGGRMEGGMRIGAGVGGLLLPAAGVGLSLAPFLGTARVHVRAVAQYWAPQTAAFDPLRDASGELQLVTGGVRVCPQLRWYRVRIPLCAGIDAGTVLGRGIGHDLVTTRSAREPWAGAVLEPGVTVSVTSRVSLWFALEGVVSLYRPRFAVEGASQAWTAGAGAVRGLFGVEVHARRDRSQNR